MSIFLKLRKKKFEELYQNVLQQSALLEVANKLFNVLLCPFSNPNNWPIYTVTMRACSYGPAMTTWGRLLETWLALPIG